jgi:hypothetical protein
MESHITFTLSKNPVFKALLSVFRFLWFAVKVILLSSVSVTYFVIGGIGAALYLVLYDKLFKTLMISLERRRPKSPYYYKWKNHHLELNYEM